MNKLLVAAIAGVLFSLVIAFIVLYATSYYYGYYGTSSPNRIIVQKNNGETENNKIPPVYVLSNVSYSKSISAMLAGLNGTITRYNISYGSTQAQEFISPLSQEKNVFFIQPNFIVASPNSTISFKLYFNISYYKLYNDSIYTDQISGYLYNFSVTQLNQSLNGFILYNVTAHVGNVKSGTLILLPIWDTKFFEIQYVIVLIN
ncbi:hypothetical protein [Sulfurisphaera ohwakuensis]|uniref:Uncharacterized protein n=1 Tax=Sulfurisphaera ohwakuensis TaxID=69656 RepID=A0A650CJ26_SULOH|nr:hypothetical protein [Sulfurisphaera ohwakuensis]MBB5253978.1 hypothetical protein [Sulfurisphaera ohwakuensis]QGR17861.1 hypothetical protein D1869_12270 [Sulfurisphaera ohwakuensis]